jgi:hypothetical protein
MSSEVTTPQQAAPAPGVLEWIYGVLFRPREVFSSWPLDRAQGVAALVVLLVAAIGGYTSAGNGAGAVMLGFFTWLGWLVLSWFLVTGLVFVIGRILKPHGEFLPLLSAIGLAYLPMIFGGPLAALAGFGKFGLAIAVLGELGIFIWTLRLLLAAIKGVMGLSTGQAVLTLVVAELTFAAVPWMLFTLGVMSLALALS